MSAWWHQGGPQESAEPRLPDYISYVSMLGSAELKRVARHWIGPEANRANKAACLEAIRTGLDNRERVRGFVAGLPEYERAVLGVLKARGGSAPPVTLASEVAALGLQIPPSRQDLWQRSNGSFDLLNRLLDRGIILAATPSSTWNRPSLRLDSTYRLPALVFSDKRLLEAVNAVPPRPLKVAAVASVGTSWARRPGEVVSDLIGVVEAIRRLGGLPATRAGRPAGGALNRLTRSLGWEGRGEAAASPSGLRHRTPFYVGLLRAWRALVRDPETGRLTIDPEMTRWMEQPYGEQAKAWVKAYRDLPDRFETSDGTFYEGDVWSGGKLGAARGMLLQGLASLPGPREGWFGCEAFSDALFDRVGEFFTLGYMPPFYAYDCKTREQLQKKRAEWREGVRQQWHRIDRPWIAGAIRGPLYELGLVEVALAPGQRGELPTCFRLTDLGRMALGQVQAGDSEVPGLLQPDHSLGPSLVVQPNFDVVVYLDRATPRLLTFMERAGERSSAGGATVTYRLTRDTVYAVLEAGIGVDELLGKLADAAAHGLPANVEATLREWAARRERLVVRRAVRLLEFPDTAARDVVATSHGSVTAVGERWLLLDPSARRPTILGSTRRAIDYAKAPVRCLVVAEDGTLTLDVSRADLLVRTEVARWAEPAEGGDGTRWRITRDSVERAIRTGTRADEILAAVFTRATHTPPPLLVAAIRAWGGSRHAATLESATILRVPDPETFQAIATSPLLRRHLAGSLGSETLVVKPEDAESIQQILRDLGLLGETGLPPGRLPAMFRPRPVQEEATATSPTPQVAEGDRQAEDGLPELDEMGGDGELNEEAFPAFPELALLLLDLPEAQGPTPLPRRGPRRPRRRPWGRT